MASTDEPKHSPPLPSEAIARVADMLWDAWRNHRTLPRPDAALWPETVADGYAVQDAVATVSGLHRVGWKVGATNRAAQQHLNLPGPVAGRLFAPFRHDSPALIDSQSVQLRALEPEIAVRMGRDLPERDRPYQAADVVGAIAWAQPALEIPDARWRDWETLGAPAFIADNAAAGLLVLGPEVEDWRDIDLAGLEARLVINGVTAETGHGHDVMGGPLNVLAWLANHLIERNKHLKAGDLVTTGTCTPIRFASPGDEVIADFGAFGQASARFE